VAAQQIDVPIDPTHPLGRGEGVVVPEGLRPAQPSRVVNLRAVLAVLLLLAGAVAVIGGLAAYDGRLAVIATGILVFIVGALLAIEEV
jgi:hypothetical protein